MNSSRIIAVIIFSVLVGINSAYATVYFDFDAESYDCDSIAPRSIFPTDIVPYSAHISCASSPQGAKHLEFTTVDNQTNTYTTITTQNMPITNTEGKVYYLAYYFNFSRINGLDIWDRNSGQSADKGIEIYGDGIRWVMSRGHWGTLTNVNADNYTVWLGNPSYHLNNIEVFDSILPNQSGYGADNPVQVRYDQWHSTVIALKVASDNTGSITAYIDGIKAFEYLNIQTAGQSSPTISKIRLGGTIAQPDYNAPAHYRKFDQFLLTDNWQDIIDAGFMKSRPRPPTLLQP